MKVSDSIVDEVRAARDAIARESGDSLEKIVEGARLRQSKGGRKVVKLTPKRAEFTKRAS